MVRAGSQSDVGMSTFALDPRLAADSLPLSELPLSSLRLMNDARWPWLILVPRVAAARELLDLNESDQAQLLREINRCSQALHRRCTPYKLNIAALGNVVAQLHVHVIARYTDDAAWPAPVWGQGTASPYSPDTLATRISELQAAIDDAGAAA
jgi:diadenosine tetraphosphate (Ap4A) HIT family hydrolase